MDSIFSKTILIGIALIAGSCSPGHITYEEFGAVGDGVHDDQSAIIEAHAVANELHLPVKAKDGATYYIGKGAKTAVIRTDVDFGTAKFVIDDRVTDDYRAAIFKVESYQDPYAVEGVETLHKGQTNLGVKLPCRSLVELTNESRRVYIRRGPNQNNGTSQKEMLVVSKDGSISKNAPVIWNYEELRSDEDSAEGRLSDGSFVTSVKAWPIDSKPLTIKGGIFTTVANNAESQYNYHGRNIVINRSNVRIQGLTHHIEGEGDHGAPYNGFISINHAAEVTVSDCLLTPHKTYGTIGSAGAPVKMGSYDIEAQFCIGLTVRNLRQTRDIDDRTWWGLFASNFCKDITMEDCAISRFDAHMGVCNVTLKDCTFGYMGVQCVGFGTMTLENCEVHRNVLIKLREDYGSSWDGDVIIRDCRLVLPEGSNNGYVIAGSNDGLHDFGYDCRLPLLVDIDGLEIDDSRAGDAYTGTTVYSSFNRDPSLPGILPFPANGRIIQHNVNTASGTELTISDNMAMFQFEGFL